MKILIIGGTTFIGPVVVRQLVAAASVSVFHRGRTSVNLPASVNRILGGSFELRSALIVTH